MIYATKAASPDRPDGVITFCRTYNDFDILSWYDRAGNLVSQSQKKILTAMECGPKEPGLNQMPDHFDLVKKSVDDIADDVPSAMGVLGNRFSTPLGLFSCCRISMTSKQIYSSMLIINSKLNWQ